MGSACIDKIWGVGDCVHLPHLDCQLPREPTVTSQTLTSYVIVYPVNLPSALGMELQRGHLQSCAAGRVTSSLSHVHYVGISPSHLLADVLPTREENISKSINRETANCLLAPVARVISPTRNGYVYVKTIIYTFSGLVVQKQEPLTGMHPTYLAQHIWYGQS